MYTVLLSLLFGAAAGASLGLTEASSPGWAVFWGLLAALAAFAGASLVLRKRLAAVMSGFQKTMETGQKQVQAKVQQFTLRPSGSPSQMMRELESIMAKSLKTAIGQTDALEPFKPWVPFMERQIATTRLQLYYQLKDYKKVDELMPRAMILDPMTFSMKLAQMHRNNASFEDIAKDFQKGVARLKYNQSALPYSVLAWMYVKAGKDEEAYNLLVKACKDNENDTLKRNRDKLANKKVREFSNAGLGEQWYALYLEQPPVQTRRVMPRADGRPF